MKASPPKGSAQPQAGQWPPEVSTAIEKGNAVSIRPTWISIREAVAVIERTLGLLTGPAIIKLEQICRDREDGVRSGGYAPGWRLLSPGDWEAPLDPNTLDLPTANNIHICLPELKLALQPDRQEPEKAGAESRLKNAPTAEIHKAICSVYRETIDTGLKPPNIKEIAVPVKARLNAKGYDASKREISRLAGDEQYRQARNPSGVTFKSLKSRAPK